MQNSKKSLKNFNIPSVENETKNSMKKTKLSFPNGISISPYSSYHKWSVVLPVPVNLPMHVGLDFSPFNTFWMMSTYDEILRIGYLKLVVSILLAKIFLVLFFSPSSSPLHLSPSVSPSLSPFSSIPSPLKN